MNKQTILERVGFFFEAMCFFLAGVMLFISYRIALFLYIGGLILAIVVGKLIKKNNFIKIKQVEVITNE